MGKRFWIEYRAQHLEILEAAVLIGRSTSCDLVLDDGLVSRRHAELKLEDGKVTLKDLGSANGVFVNHERVETDCRLVSGDAIVIGSQEMTFREGPGAAQQKRRMAETLHGPAVTQLAQEIQADDGIEGDTTEGSAIELLGGVVDKALQLGRGAEAERILSSHLANVMMSVEAGLPVPESVCSKSALYAVRLGEATGKGQWVDYAVELYTTLGKPLPGEAVDLLYSVLRKVKSIDLPTLRDYAEVLRRKQTSFGPADRFRAQRIAGLEQIVLAM